MKGFMKKKVALQNRRGPVLKDVLNNHENGFIKINTSSRFYSNGEALRNAIKDSTVVIMNSGPVKLVEEANEQRELNENETNRFMFFSELKKYYTRNSFLRSMYFKAKKHNLSKKQVDVSWRIINKYKQHDSELGVEND
jgi:protein associated with RNAse G/E